MDPFVVSLVLNWNRPADTAGCVASLLQGDYPSQQVVVVDNGSTDNSVDYLHNLFAERIQILRAESNLFFAGGTNLGLQWALDRGADMVLVLNNDTVVASTMVRWLVQTALADPNVGILAPMIYYGHAPSRIWALGSRRHKWLPFPRNIGAGELDRGQYTIPLEVDYVTGCAMMVRQVVPSKIGLFDTTYQMYYEDADYCARAQCAGFRLLVEPRAKMWHLVSATARTQAARSRYQKTRYRIRFYRQHSHGPMPWLTYALLWGQEMARSAGALLRGNPRLVWAGWRGLWDGFRGPVGR